MGAESEPWLISVLPAADVLGCEHVDDDAQPRRSRCIQLIQSAEISCGQTASHSRLLLQLPKPSTTI
jgi:hypothetical protein